MNIYDEVLLSIEGLPHTIKVPLRRFIKEAQKKDIRSQKEHELLGLYQKRFSFYNFDEDKSLREIKLKEKELEEMK